MVRSTWKEERTKGVDNFCSGSIKLLMLTISFASMFHVSCVILCIFAVRILREAARPFITDDIYNRVKHPYLAPPAFMNQKTKLHDLVQTTIRSPALKDLWWLDADKLVKQLDDLTAMLKTVDPKTMTIDEREKYAAMLFGADIKFLSITSYVLLRKLFNVE